ncbi:MAG: flagellin lysine-N-methylase [Clostridia bacterium]|nr:flagellin lysine-N-methylase [Clostridia bacterium]
MQEPQPYFMPDYFSSFSCKMGDCRHACCVGWPITISMTNYFTLLGIDCSESLRRRLDCALHLTGRPSEFEYAQFSPRWDGDCPLRMEDGRCGIQAELGEEPLPDVCRLYPRGIRMKEGGGYEISCANSCEATLELFLHRTEKLTFREAPLSIVLPPLAPPTERFATEGRGLALRMRYIEVMQDRRYMPVDRLTRLYLLLEATEASYGNAAGLDAILHDSAAHLTFGDAKMDHDISLEHLTFGDAKTGHGISLEHLTFGDAKTDHGISLEHLTFGIGIAEEIVTLLDSRSESIRDYGERALRNLGKAEDAVANYHRLKAKFESDYPNWAIFFEHLLVNHMFFVQFPFQDRPYNLKEEFAALCTIYALLRFLCVGLAEEIGEESALVDLLAAAFRLIDHTDFDRTAIAMLRRIGCTPEGLRDLTAL